MVKKDNEVLVGGYKVTSRFVSKKYKDTNDFQRVVYKYRITIINVETGESIYFFSYRINTNGEPMDSIDILGSLETFFCRVLSNKGCRSQFDKISTLSTDEIVKLHQYICSMLDEHYGI